MNECTLSLMMWSMVRYIPHKWYNSLFPSCTFILWYWMSQITSPECILAPSLLHDKSAHLPCWLAYSGENSGDSFLPLIQGTKMNSTLASPLKTLSTKVSVSNSYATKVDVLSFDACISSSSLKLFAISAIEALLLARPWRNNSFFVLMFSSSASK